MSVRQGTISPNKGVNICLCCYANRRLNAYSDFNTGWNRRK